MTDRSRVARRRFASGPVPTQCLMPHPIRRRRRDWDVTSAAEVSSLLATVDLFSGLDPESLARLVGVVEICEVPGGTVLMRQDEAAEYVFVVLAGRLQVRVRDDSGANAVSSATWVRAKWSERWRSSTARSGPQR